MEIRDLDLMAAYYRTASELIDAVKRTFSVTNILSAYWEGVLPQDGSLKEPSGGTFHFHGTGCRFTIGDRIADVEFLPGCDELGFDAWRLWYYAKHYLGYTHLSLDSIQTSLSVACNQELLVLRDNLYFFPQKH